MEISAPAGVDRFDWEVVAFMVSWAPYGGPSEDDVLPAFGMTCSQLEERFALIVDALSARRRLRLTLSQHQLFMRAVELRRPARRGLRRRKTGPQL